MSHPCSPLSPNDIVLLPCAGAGNLGQLTNTAAVELAREGFGRLYCLAGIAAGLEDVVSEVRKTRIAVAIDGCPTGCTRRIMEKNDLSEIHHLVLTDLGIEQRTDLTLDPDALQLVKDAIQACCAEAKPIVRLGGCMCGI